MRRKIVSLICTCVCFFLLQTANAENILKNRGDSLVVGDLYLLESRYSQRNAALLAGPLETIGFQKYYGGSLPQSITDERRMYTLWSEFSVDSSLKEMELGLGLGPIDYPCEIFFNGVQIGVIGQYEGGYRSILYTSSEVFFPPELVLSGEKKNALALQFFPLYETENKAFGDLVIADFVAVSRTTFLRNLFNTHFIRAAGIIALILFVYFLFLYGVARRRDRKNLLFALTCLAFFSDISISPIPCPAPTKSSSRKYHASRSLISISRVSRANGAGCGSG